MKTFLSLVFACFTFALCAQTSFVPAQSLVNENAVASLEGAFFTEEEETVASPELEEVENHFNIKLSSNPYFGDITINYDLATSADVTVEVLRGDREVLVVSNTANAGKQKTLWNKSKIGSGIYTVRVIANNKVCLLYTSPSPRDRG